MSPSAPPTALLPDCRYDRMTSLFEGDRPSGWNCTTIPQLKTALERALQVRGRASPRGKRRGVSGDRADCSWRWPTYVGEGVKFAHLHEKIL